MAKLIKQIRYYNDSKENSPEGLTYRSLVSGTAFSNYTPIIQLGIQALPGTQFYLNGSNNPIIIGNTGIYELNVEGLTEINSLQFNSNSLNTIKNNNNAYLIVDIIYEGSGK